MVIIPNLQKVLLRLGWGLTWARVLFVAVLLLVMMVSLLRQDGLSVLAKASSQSALSILMSRSEAGLLSWKTVYSIDKLAQGDPNQVSPSRDSFIQLNNQADKSTHDNESGEALFLKSYQLLRDGDHAQALNLAQNMTQRFPHFQLGQLLYADLMASVAGDVPDRVDVLQNPDAQRRLSQLKTEALQRTRHAGKTEYEGKVPELVRFLSPSLRQVVVIDAKKSRLYLLVNHAEDSGKRKLQMVFDAYVSIGHQGMGKRFEGDAKTPTGVYFIQKHLTDPMLPDLYGSGALTLDYPNPLDKEQKRTGSGIWLHGSPSEQYARPPNATDGCVVLANDDMTRLILHGIKADTPVIIAEKLTWVNVDTSTAAAKIAASQAAWSKIPQAQQNLGAWKLISAFEWTDQAQTLAVLSYELQIPGQAPKRRHSYWMKEQRWKEVSGPF